VARRAVTISVDRNVSIAISVDSNFLQKIRIPLTMGFMRAPDRDLQFVKKDVDFGITGLNCLVFPRERHDIYSRRSRPISH
jgi:hypothetical protein